MNNNQVSQAISRRKILKISACAIAGAAIANTATYSFSPKPEPITYQSWVNPYRDIRGFNYQPSYEATGYSIWRQFRPDKFKTELGLGKKYFPKINTVRYWLSFDAFGVEASDCGNLSRAGIGFMPHALHESLVGDLHRAQFGVLSSASSMHFIEMDGSLRAGHEIFNDF